MNPTAKPEAIVVDGRTCEFKYVVRGGMSFTRSGYQIVNSHDVLLKDGSWCHWGGASEANSWHANYDEARAFALSRSQAGQGEGFSIPNAELMKLVTGPPADAPEADEERPWDDADGWRDIATAPKDGTRVLVYWPYWCSEPFVAYYCGESGGWEGDRCVSPTHAEAFPERQPTHWMRLPAPPAQPASIPSNET